MGVVARSYRTVVVLAALIALWALAAYEWLGLPAESSALLMILSFIWAIVQLARGSRRGGGNHCGCGGNRGHRRQEFAAAVALDDGAKKVPDRFDLWPHEPRARVAVQRHLWLDQCALG